MKVVVLTMAGAGSVVKESRPNNIIGELTRRTKTVTTWGPMKYILVLLREFCIIDNKWNGFWESTEGSNESHFRFLNVTVYLEMYYREKDGKSKGG